MAMPFRRLGMAPGLNMNGNRILFPNCWQRSKDDAWHFGALKRLC